MEFKCSKCGEVHEEWPALAFMTPDSYDQLSEDEKNNIAEISQDFCVITYEDQTDRFIRAVLFQKVNNNCEDLHYGVWVSLSERSYNDYKKNYKSMEHEAIYFGYLNTQIPEYHDTTNIKTNVVITKGNKRPEIIPHEDQMGDPFVKDYYEGITKEEAENRIRAMIESN